MLAQKIQYIQLKCSNLFFRNIFKVLYKLSHTGQAKHNRRFWPYYQVERDANQGLQKIYFKHQLVVDNTQPITPKNTQCMMLATGPSVGQIPQNAFQQADMDYIGLNGAIAMSDVHFAYYVIIDHNFIDSRFDLVKKVLERDCIFYTTPRCLDQILRKVLFNEIRCQFRVIEPITRNEIEPMLGSRQVIDFNQDYIFSAQGIGFSKQVHTAVFDYFTVAYVALQIINALRYETVYLAGLDMNNFAQPRFYEDRENKQPTLLDRSLDATLPAFALAATFFQQQGVQVINLSEQSAVESFTKINPNHIWSDSKINASSDSNN